MKFKLDENIGDRGQDLFRQAGFDVSTIVEQALMGAPDSEVIAVCQREQRCLVTLDLDFSNPLNFQPSLYSGTAVLRLPRRPNHQDFLDAVKTLIKALQEMDIRGQLWIVQRGSVRIYQEEP
jgi:hypothetical protein